MSAPGSGPRKELLELFEKILGEDVQARNQAATDLVDLGPDGAAALAKVLRDADVSAHREGMVALLHAWADFAGLEIPDAVQDDLVDAAIHFLRHLEDNRSGVAWMVADVLAQHVLEGKGPRVRARVETAFAEVLDAPAPAARMAGAYGLARLRTEDAEDRLERRELEEPDPRVLAYLAATRDRLARDEDPELLPVD